MSQDVLGYAMFEDVLGDHASKLNPNPPNTQCIGVLCGRLSKPVSINKTSNVVRLVNIQALQAEPQPCEPTCIYSPSSLTLNLMHRCVVWQALKLLVSCVNDETTNARCALVRHAGLAS